MTSQPVRSEISSAFRFEFDSTNKILLVRFQGRLTNESVEEAYSAIRKYSTLTDALSGIWDMSAVTEFAVSGEFIRDLALRDPAMPDAFRRPRVIVAPTTAGFGIARMFQLAGEPKRPLLSVVRAMDEALNTIRIQSPHFESLE